LSLLAVGEAPAAVVETEGFIASRYGGEPGSFILIRPDQHVAARFRAFDPEAIEAALARALGNNLAQQEPACVA
jgi:3-(3-hydroxy-phenyl)propionate hydroxylase